MPRRHRGIWIAASVVAVVVLVGVGGALVLFLARDEPDERPLDEAVDEFRRSEEPEESPVGSLRPPTGVYTATATGSASLSFPPLSAEHGPQVPVTVTHDDERCWRLRVDFNEAQWQAWRFCVSESGDQLVDGGGESYQLWDLGATTTDNRSTFRCDRGATLLDLDAGPGTSSPGSCEGTGTAMDGTTAIEGQSTFVGEEQVQVDGTDVPARHVHIEQRLTGAQEGTSVVDWWFSTSNGLPVRFERTTTVSTSSPIGAIEYQEETSWVLQSLTPQT